MPPANGACHTESIVGNIHFELHECFLTDYNVFVGRAVWKDDVPEPPRVVHLRAVKVVASNIRQPAARDRVDAMAFAANVLNSTGNTVYIKGTALPEPPPDDLDYASRDYPSRLVFYKGRVYLLTDIGRRTERIVPFGTIMAEGSAPGRYRST